jgi:oligoendopeptidase F
MHSFFSNANNRAANSHYRIFVAEVASTVNEVLLINHLLKKYDNNPKVRAYLLNKFIVEMIGTMYRQPFFADFEASLFDHHEQGHALSNKFITDTYLQKTKAYYGPAITVPDEVAYHCYLVPHFYYRFYVYKYTLGMVCALAIAKRILAGDKPQVKSYLNFLKSGGTKWPVDLLKGAQVDPTAQAVYDDAFQYFGDILAQFKQALHQLG